LIHNVGFPLSFSFGPRECIKLENWFYTAFRDESNVDLSQDIPLSDQGTALKVIVRRHPRHLFCLRHLLQGFRKYKHGQTIGNLVKERGQKEFDVLCNIHARRFRALWATGGTELNDLRAYMKRVGLAFLNGSVQIANLDRWRQVSMLERRGTRMLATSNAIESLNGHPNRVTPRWNRFSSSLIRLANACLRKGQTFHRSLKRNHQYECRKSLRRQHAVAENQMASETAFFGTTDVVCLCGETQFASDMDRIALPCSHQFAVRFQAMSDLIQHHFGGMPSEPPIVELIIPDLHWRPGTISFAIDQMVPYCPRDT
jgi:hypothetical protein